MADAEDDKGVDLTLAEMREIALREEADSEESPRRPLDKPSAPEGDAVAPASEPVDEGADDADPSRSPRHAYQRVKGELQQAREQIARMEGAYRALIEAQQVQGPKQAEPELGYLDRFDQDPATTVRDFFARVDQARHRTAAQQAEERQRQQQFAQFDQRFTQVAQAIAPMEAEFRAQTPDYDQGVIYATKELAERFVADGNPPEIAARMAKYEMARQAEDASRRGQNPARRLYALAQAWGYQSQQGESAAAPVVERLREGQKRQNPVSQANGRSQKAITNLADLSKLPKEKFWSEWDKIKRTYGSTA